MKQYLNTLRNISTTGRLTSDRTGTGRYRIFGCESRFDLRDGFPLVTTRKIPYKAMIKETLWFLTGSKSVAPLNEQGVKIWDDWAVGQADIDAFIEKYKESLNDADAISKYLTDHAINDIGMMYGNAWRNAPVGIACSLWPEVPREDIASDKLAQYLEKYAELPEPHKLEVTEDAFIQHMHYQTVDQIQQLIVNLKKRPYSARHVVTAWIPEYVPFEELSPQENVLIGKAALASCHHEFQCFVLPPEVEGGKMQISMKMCQRSADFPVGSVWNIAQYALLLSMLAQVTGMEARELIYSTGDTHIYADQMHLVQEQLSREPLPLPTLKLNPDVTDIFKFTLNDIFINDYEAHPAIDYPVAK